MKFENSQDQNTERDSNKRIKELFRSTLNLRGGGEFLVPGTELRLRAGYAILPSPYKGDPASYARQLLTCGAGYTIDNTITLDVTYMRGWHENYEYLYGNSVNETRIDDKIKSNNVMVTLSYKF
jgi:long-subunit fatty acid transport protein